MTKPTLFCDICGKPIPDDGVWECEACRSAGKVPTRDSLAEAMILNAMYWSWRAERNEFERIADDQGFKVMADGSVKAYETNGQKRLLDDIDNYHFGQFMNTASSRPQATR